MSAGDALNIKQRRFCELYIQTRDRIKSYREAYNQWTSSDLVVSTNASKLACGHGAKYIAELEAELTEIAMKQALVTREMITDQLDEDRSLAHSVGQPGAAVSATMGKARLHGLIIDKSEVDMNVSGALVERMQEGRRRASKRSE